MISMVESLCHQIETICEISNKKDMCIFIHELLELHHEFAIRMLTDFFTPVPESLWAPLKGKTQLTGGKLKIYANTFPKLKKTQIALMGLSESANMFRKYFYDLAWRFGDIEIADLGNLVETNDEKQRQFALSEAVGELLNINVIVVIVGGNTHATFSHYKAYRQQLEPIEIVNVTPSIDFEEGTPLRQILIDKPSNLFNIDFVGTQAYYISENTASLLEKMYFENHRLGEVRNNIEETEPILRSSHLLMFDMNSLRLSDAPGTVSKSPNGLYAEEAARISRYAGVSNKLSSAFFYGLDDQNLDSTSHQLLAQMIWYFIDGVTARYYDHPETNHPDFLIFRNKLNSTGHEITFYKSRKSNRWWMEIPHPYDNKTFFIGCSYKDYELVCNGEMPDRWWRAYQRLM